MELVDTTDLKSVALVRGGSSPSARTNNRKNKMSTEKWNITRIDFESLMGLVFRKVEIVKGTDTVIFEVSDDLQFQLYHEQECCESVWIADVYGDVEDLENTPVLLAEEVDGNLPPLDDKDDLINPATGNYSDNDSYTWTFYKLRTIKGYLELRFYGESNGYYSEKAQLFECRRKRNDLSQD